jgi:selenocysteine lyase/cysteine desulfurase
MMAGPVMAEFIRQTERVNVENSFYARGAFREEQAAVRQRVASALGADVSEIALTRGATEALQCLIGNYNRLKPGDAVMYADLDYPAMQYAMNWLSERRGTRVVRITIPEPATYDNVLDLYRTALRANPQVRLLLLTHVNNKTGLMIPTAAIADEARRRGVDVIVDAAHSFGQMDIRVADVGADFIGFNLHKWIGAPVGVGVMYIRKGRLAEMDRMMADEDGPADSILSRVHTGTTNFATVLTVPAALDFHDAVGRAHKAARVRYLRDRWVTAAREIPGVDVLAPDDPRMAAAITSFRLRGRTSSADNQRIVEELRDRHGFFTVRRNGVDAGDCVRVTPSLYNTPSDLDRFVAALRQVAAGV